MARTKQIRKLYGDIAEGDVVKGRRGGWFRITEVLPPERRTRPGRCEFLAVNADSGTGALYLFGPATAKFTIQPRRQA